MKVYVYKKAYGNRKRERVEIFENVLKVVSAKNYFSIVTVDHEIYDYDKHLFMITAYGY